MGYFRTGLHEPCMHWSVTVPAKCILALTVTGLLYTIISPIIVPFQVLVFLLFWIIYSRSFLLRNTNDGGGAFYPTALKQLFAGIYTMEVSLTALFLLVRDPHGQAKCIGQACFMILAIVLTAVYHHVVCKSFNPLLVFYPTSMNMGDRTGEAPQFQHHALYQDAIVRLPRDSLGISQTKVDQNICTGISVQNDHASIDSAGRIRIEDFEGAVALT